MTVFDYMRLPATDLKTSTFHAETNAFIQVNAKRSADTGEHFWQVKAKTVGTLPLTAVAYLQPGDTLPELTQGKVSTRTTYRYNTQPHTATYGQLNQLSVIKYRAATPFVKGSALLMAAVPHPAVAQEKITVNVQHEINKSAQTRTTVMKVTADESTGGAHLKNFQGIKNLNSAGSGISLGTTVYSLTTGDKIASHDALKEMQTKWHYDHWGRAIRQEVTPASGGNIHKRHISSIFLPRRKRRSLRQCRVVSSLKRSMMHLTGLSPPGTVLLIRPADALRAVGTGSLIHAVLTQPQANLPVIPCIMLMIPGTMASRGPPSV